MRNFRSVFTLLVLVSLCGCAVVDVTKTAKGFYPPTKPDDVEILMTAPGRKYVELATISTNNWSPNATAKMHNALRAKAAPIGADAVILLNSGVNPEGYLWSTGIAVKFQ